MAIYKLLTYLKKDLVNFDMLTTFLFGVALNLLQQKSPTVEIIGIYFPGMIVARKYMPIVSAVGLFCCDKFEETPNEELSNMSKLTKSYFKKYSKKVFLKIAISCFWYIDSIHSFLYIIPNIGYFRLR